MKIALSSELVELYETGETKDKELRKLIKSFPWVPKQFMTVLNDLSTMESTSVLVRGFRKYNYEQLKGDKKGFSSIRLKYREPVRMIFTESDEGIAIHVVDLNKHYGDK